jgi:two-component system, response regulator PdtaR
VVGLTNVAVLHGLTVLVVEDGTLVALELEQIVNTAGCHVLGPAATVGEALLLLRDNTPAVALLDVQLVDGMITPVAEILQTLGVPFVLVSGYKGPELQQPALATAPYVSKPINEQRLLAALVAAVAP